jgi:hypothetical protein
MQVAGLCMASSAVCYDWVVSDQWRLPPLTRSGADAAARAAAQAVKRSAPGVPTAAGGGSVDDTIRDLVQRMASLDYDGQEEGVAPIVRALGRGHAAGVVEAAAKLHAAVPHCSQDWEGLHLHMWYLYATAQHLLQQSGLSEEAQSLVLGLGALPDSTIR